MMLTSDTYTSADIRTAILNQERHSNRYYECKGYETRNIEIKKYNYECLHKNVTDRLF